MSGLFALPFQRVRSAELELPRPSAFVAAVAAAAEGIAAHEGDAARGLGAGRSIHRHHGEGAHRRALLLGEGGGQGADGGLPEAHRHGRRSAVAARAQSREQGEGGTVPVSDRRTQLSGKQPYGAISN